MNHLNAMWLFDRGDNISVTSSPLLLLISQGPVATKLLAAMMKENTFLVLYILFASSIPVYMILLMLIFINLVR